MELRRQTLSVLGLFALVWGLASCAPPAKKKPQILRANKAVRVMDETNGTSNQSLRSESPIHVRFYADPIEAPNISSWNQGNENQNLTNDIKSLSIYSWNERKQEFQIQINWRQSSRKPTLLTIFLKKKNSVSAGSSHPDILVTEAQCQSERGCNHLRLKLLRQEDQASTLIGIFIRREYLKAEDVAAIKKSPPLLRQAIEYHLPILRVTLALANGTPFQNLVLLPPPVDESEQRSQNGPHALADQLIIPLDDFNRTESPSNELNPAPLVRVTPNLYEAYDLQLPPGLSSGQEIRDSTHLLALRPISQQEPFEPSYRMAWIASEIVKRRIKFFRNACNLFVQTVLSLTGYASDKTYVANDFEYLVGDNDQGLRDFERRQFQSHASLHERDLHRLQQIYASLPANHATLVQQDREILKTSGHVFFVIKQEGKLYVMESSLDDYGPRKRELSTMRSLLNENNPLVRVFSEQGLVQESESI